MLSLNENVSRSPRTVAIGLHLLFALGILIALFGVGIDYVLPGTSPGLNLPQLLVIAAGLALSLGAHQLRREEVRRKLSSERGRSTAIALVIALITLIVLEILLSVFGMSTYFPSQELDAKRSSAPWRVCDEAGCRYDYNITVDACARGDRTGRWCIVNRQGFADHDDFVFSEDLLGRTRILALGDSFTHGYSAEVGKSFVETIEARLPEVVVWNAGFTGTGTNQALASFELLGPILEPDLTVLGFYVNDFVDNLIPTASWLSTVDQEGNHVFVRPYRLDAWDNLIRLDEKSAQYFITYGVYPPANEFERVLGSSRLGTLVLRLRDFIAKLNADDRRFDKGIAPTREYLLQLRESTATQYSDLLVLLIPDREDLTAASDRFLTAVNLMNELQLQYINPMPILDPEEDYAPLPDNHWNNSGHQKVGALLSDCIEVFIDSGNLGDCEYVIMP